MIKNKFTPFLGVLTVVIVWAIIPATNIVSKSLFPDILDVVGRLFKLMSSGLMWPNLWGTLYRTIIGFVISSVLAIPIGLFLGSKKAFRVAINPIVDFFRFLPGTAMFPLFLLMFGIGDGSKIAISIFISFWIILINTMHGVIYSSKTRQLAAQSLGANKQQIFWGVTLMDALPHIMTGLKNGLSLSLVAVVVSEMFIGSNIGLGQKIYDSYLTYESADLYAWLVVTGFLGFILSKTFILFDKKFLHWVDK